ncbi:MAG: hypothetical protein ACSW73_00170 [Spirochaetales bacterium]
MGSGISTKYEKTYFYKLNDDEPLSVSEKTYEYNVNDTHTIESHNDEEVIKFCEDMVSRKPYEDSSYAQNLANTAQHFEMNEMGLFGKKGVGKKVRIIETDNPMNSAMNFYSQISEGGLNRYVENHHGIKAFLSDGVDILFRPYPKTIDSPAVEIKVTLGELIQKIHFIQR